MFENFSDRGRLVIGLAQDQARDLQHHYIGTEHLLLGVLTEEQGGAAQVLAGLGVTTERARRGVRHIVGAGPDPVAGQMPFNPRARNILLRANRIRLSLGDAAVEPEHLLLALIREDGGVAIQLLVRFDVNPATIRSRLIEARSEN